MSKEAIELTSENFDKETKTGSWLIDFWAVWCGPCKILEPIVDEMGKKYDGKIKVGKINVDENQELSERFEVMSIPTLLYMKNGKQINRTIGAVPKDTVEKAIKEIL